MRANDIEERYLDDTITPEELQALRTQLNSESDDEVGKRMQERWEEYEYDGGIGKDELDSMWDKISSRAVNYAPKPRNSWRWLRVAAAIAVPLFLFTSIYYYHKSSSLSSAEIAIATGNGERASITLPDGTFVNLNEKTTLRYDSKSFNSKKRNVDFDGEAYFEVSKDPEHPFSINADHLAVTVLGTKFNLKARTVDSSCVLTLDEGRTRLTAIGTGNSVTLNQNQKATLMKDSGTFSVEDLGSEPNDATAWRKRQIIFRNAPVKVVLNTLENTFDVKFSIKDSLDMNDSFTGTMSDNNLDIDLSILEKIYNINAMMAGDTVIIAKE